MKNKKNKNKNNNNNSYSLEVSNKFNALNDLNGNDNFYDNIKGMLEPNSGNSQDTDDIEKAKEQKVQEQKVQEQKVQEQKQKVQEALSDIIKKSVYKGQNFDFNDNAVKEYLIEAIKAVSPKSEKFQEFISNYLDEKTDLNKIKERYQKSKSEEIIELANEPIVKEAIGSIKGQIEGLDYSNTRNADDAINEFFAEKFTALFTKLFPKPSDDDSKYRKELIIKSKIKQVIFNKVFDNTNDIPDFGDIFFDYGKAILDAVEIYNNINKEVNNEINKEKKHHLNDNIDWNAVSKEVFLIVFASLFDTANGQGGKRNTTTALTPTALTPTALTTQNTTRTLTTQIASQIASQITSQITSSPTTTKSAFPIGLAKSEMSFSCAGFTS